MRKLSIVLLGLSLLATACESRKTTDATQTSDTATATPVTDNSASNVATLTPRLQALGLTPDHAWQNVNLGDDFSALKANAKAEPFEQDVKHVGYTTEFDNLESVDYQYFQDNGKINKIQVDLYLNTAQSVADYKKDLITYLTGKYGSAASIAQGSSWQQGKVTLLDVSKGKDFGLRLVIK
ncbi:hypothetical protein FAES_1261 [Fibrella aestuarina BUZ 2]|uniref:Lipoprotein n=1 Tax=Fibrella aestuarina BUZ 2 TaxID=1166018 RepID=I0K568_9BACT|nr:hypothetical protein [Fibrella aestuarina]CCG99271.1 hypothetical protein FAES_1261 [Fibrella aestuarina BUZ 2]